MTRKSSFLLLFLTLSLLLLSALCACGAAEEESAPSAAPISEPAPEASPTPTPEPTPDLSPLPDEWFDDAAFFGDSIMVTLQKHCLMTGDLGDALFLCMNSYSVHNAVSGQLQIWYDSVPYSPQDVLPQTGANKVFIMLGVNDIALYGGVDKTMVYWETFLSAIQEVNPDVTVFIISCLPVFHGAEYDIWNNDLFDDYNGRLRALSEEHGCVYVDVAHYFKDEDNGLALAYCRDRFCHLNYDGTALWAQELKNPVNYSVDPRSIDYGADR